MSEAVRMQESGYDALGRQLASLLEDETDELANLANTTAVVFHGVDRLNWAGFYLRRGEELVLGPFQGKVACTRIPLGRGVCGTAAARRESVRVDDVHRFEGHIACDPESRSELVVPVVVGGELLGVLDLDSPEPGRFDAADQRGVEGLVAVLVRRLEAVR